MNIRIAKIDDAPEIRTLIIEAVNPEKNEDFDEDGREFFLQPNTIESITRRLGDTNYLTLCYIVGERIVGIITMHNYEKLDQLFVHPDSRNMKVATKLWQAAEKMCSENGNKGKYWTKSSTLAVNVYRSFGFRLDGDRMKQKGIIFYPMVLEIEKQS